MKFGGFVLLTVSIAVAVLTLTSVLVPAVSMAVDTEDTFTNDGIVRMGKYDDTAELTAFWDHTKPNEITVNGDVVKLPKFVTSGVELSLTVSGTADFMLRYVSMTQNNQTIAFIDNDGSIVAGVNAGTDATITVSNGTLTFNNGTNTKTGTFTDSLYFVNNSGDYVMKAPTDQSYLNGDSEITGIGRTKVGSSNYSMFIQGSIDDGWTAEVTTGTGVTVGTVTGVYSESSGYLDLYRFTGVTFTATLSGTDYPVTYNQVIVPYEVTAEKAIHADSATRTLFEIIPIFMVLAILLGIVAVLYVKYRK